jgi:23S rRNA pseudouridine1911/1915/1917 synthase
MRTETFTVDHSLPGERLDTFLRTRFAEVSRGTFQRLIQEGHITIDGKPVKVTHQPRAGQQIEIRWPEPKSAEALPEEIPLQILFEDADLLVLNKPAGMVVHPAAGHDEHTLVNALLHHCKGQLSGIGGVARPGIVHRLDKDTSGCLVVAKNDATHLILSEQFAGRTLEKIYNAILCGDLPRESGEIHAAIARHPTHRKRMAVMDRTGREARTGYKVLERLQGATFVEIILHTGRTHQIRVHFQHLGFPVVGDDTYGAKHNKRLTEKSGLTAPRQLLHARKIGFVHPKTKKKMSFQAPLPADFQEVLQALR